MILKENEEGVSTTNYNAWVEDCNWWFPPPQRSLGAHDDIDQYDEFKIKNFLIIVQSLMGLEKNTFLVCLYCCKADVLLLSNCILIVY